MCVVFQSAPHIQNRIYTPSAGVVPGHPKYYTARMQPVEKKIVLKI